ncbi:MAG: hypothetical protein ACK452_15720, partial [Bacteroidota bacterium]
DNTGSFKINNLRPGKYKVFAFGDKNKNMMFDQAEESIDEWPDTPNSTIELVQNESHDFSVFKDYGNKLFIKRQYFDGVGKIKYCFNRPLKIPELKSAYSNEILKYFSKTKDTLTVYFTNDLPDTLMISLYENKVLADTLYLIKPVVNPNSSKGILKPRILFAGEAINDSALYLFFNTALKKNRLLKNLIKVRGSEENEILKFDSISPESCQLIFKNRMSDGEIVLAPDIIESWYGQKNDSVKIKFAFPSITSKGELKINLLTKFSSNHILQLMNESNQVVYEQTLNARKDNLSKLVISGITTGNYKLRVVVDANGDEVWTSGDLLMKIKPEKVYYYDKPIEIISEWETNIEFNV